jgi:hypothetical protein
MITQMLALDSPRWDSLAHANGSAKDVPAWLAELKSGDRDEAMCEIVSALCLHNSVYSATFAAVPHVVRLSPYIRSSLRVDALSFVGKVVAYSEQCDLEACDDDIKLWYDAAIQQAGDIAVATIVTEKYSPDTAIYLFEALAAIKGCRGPGRHLSSLANGEFHTTCPECAGEISVTPERRWFLPTQGVGAGDVEPLQDELPAWDGSDFSCENSFVWLSQLALKAGKPPFALGLRHLYGWVTCGACQARFRLMDRISETTESL